MRSFRANLLLLAATALTGCLESNDPLIADADSVHPLPEGDYIGVQFGADVLDSTESGRARVVHEGAGMRFVVESEPEDEPTLSTPLGDGFYVFMPYGPSVDTFSYMLGRATGSRFTFYDYSHDCDRLQELWLRDGATPEQVGMTVMRGSSVSRCRFERYEDLARAFRALIADGRLEPLFVIEPAAED